MTAPRAGSIRYTDEHGDVHEAHPHDVMYSSVTMLATEFWDEDAQAWKRIWDDNSRLQEQGRNL